MGAAALPAIGMGLSAAQGIGSGIKGHRAAGQADRRRDQLEQHSDMVMGIAGNQMRDLGGLFHPSQAAGLQGQIMDMAQGAVPGLQGILGGAADQLMGGSPLLDQAAGALGQDFDFTGGPGPQVGDFESGALSGLAQQEAMGFADRARTTALEQQAAGMRGTQDAVSMMMADRGMGAGSGPAAQAMAQMGTQMGQQATELERGLADMAGQQALQAGQFDAQFGLQADQQRFGQELAAGQFGRQGEQLAAQHALAQAQGLGGLQQLGDQRLLAGAQLGQEALTSPIGMLQGLYQQNFVQPHLQAASIMNPAQMLDTAARTSGGLMDQRMRGVESAGTGKGAGLGGAVGQIPALQSAMGSKGAGAGGGAAPMGAKGAGLGG